MGFFAKKKKKEAKTCYVYLRKSSLYKFDIVLNNAPL